MNTRTTLQDGLDCQDWTDAPEPIERSYRLQFGLFTLDVNVQYADDESNYKILDIGLYWDAGCKIPVEGGDCILLDGVPPNSASEIHLAIKEAEFVRQHAEWFAARRARQIIEGAV